MEKKKGRFQLQQYQSMYANCLEPMILDFNSVVELSHPESLKGISYLLYHLGTCELSGTLPVKASFCVRG